MRYVALLMLCCSLLAADDSPWSTQVPDKERRRPNPVTNEHGSAAAGAKIFKQNCAACHGAHAEGHKQKPSLHSDRVQGASDGELFWLLTNGNLKRGMPSWSRLPDAQRWQVVTFLKSLP